MNLPSSFRLVGLGMLTLCFGACGNPCPDYPLTANLLRFFPYQLNQSLVFENTAQQLDTLTVSAYNRMNTIVSCVDNPNRDFLYEVIDVTLGSMTGDSTFVMLSNTTSETISLRFEACCDFGTSFDPITGILDQPLNSSAKAFTFQTSEVVHGTTYQNVSTYVNAEDHASKMQAVKLAMDDGIVAYQDVQGGWWYLR